MSVTVGRFENQDGMKVTVRAPVTHLCPYRTEVDEGTAEITFDIAGGDAPELHDLNLWLRTFAERRISHEDMTRQIAYSLGAERVVTRWVTADMNVTCDLSREPVRT